MYICLVMVCCGSYDMHNLFPGQCWIPYMVGIIEDTKELHRLINRINCLLKLLSSLWRNQMPGLRRFGFQPLFVYITEFLVISFLLLMIRTMHVSDKEASSSSDSEGVCYGCPNEP
jgi:hypothetical protein